MKRSDWNLLILAAAGQRGLTPVQFQKTLFLLGKHFQQEVEAEEPFYDFQPYNYGVFDADVYCDAEKMQPAGLTKVQDSGSGYKQYYAAPAGMERAHQLSAALPGRVTENVNELVKWAQSLSFSQLVQAVYTSYPETKANSIFKG